MNELEMIANAIKTLGESGQAAFVWWIIKGVLANITNTACWAGFFYLVWKMFSRIMAEIRRSEDRDDVRRRINDAADVTVRKLTEELDKNRTK